ncbi:SH3 and multiple ankyrin repeat domains protein 1-like isoform X2 [Eriocheir sinensis]|uniref:SH3 and multiple ankyrin repeat domains protein 1-like isoform X2 n=1 Tax=Eriocheir sinensis TaxID=95602 RepID=UPI0021C763C5|nr:SH3 and multiple ankyrin repeat domains protein 1-like isoform X2 [Eriocheir sinensis]
MRLQIAAERLAVKIGTLAPSLMTNSPTTILSLVCVTLYLITLHPSYPSTSHLTHCIPAALTTQSSEMSSEVSSGCSVRSRPTSQTSTDTLTCDDLPMAADAPDMPPPATIPPSSSTSSIGPYHHPHPHHHHHQHHHNHHHHHHHLHHSHNPHLGRRARTPRHLHPPLRTSDLPRESPALESPIEPFPDSEFVSECDACDPVEHHSSEEELETLTGSWPRETGPPEKRKWSQVARVSLTDSGSSDEEVCGLTTGPRPPVQFRTSPPLEAHKPLRSVSPPTKVLSLANSGREGMSSVGGGETSGSPGVAAGNDGGTTRTESGPRAASPRKRHRQTPRPHQMHRPCLDFEKMQQLVPFHW